MVQPCRNGRAPRRGVTEHPLPYDLHNSLIDIGEAARLADVSRSVVWNWITRGYRDRDGQWATLPAEKQGHRRWVRPIDVLQAEADTRRRARR